MTVHGGIGMTASGSGTFFDGKTTMRHAVTVELEPGGLVVRGDGGREFARWPYEELDHLASHDGVFRIGRIGGRRLERLEVRDLKLAAAIDELSTIVDRTGRSARRGRVKVVAWSMAAVASLVAVGIFAVPEIATRLTPIIPYAVERKLGEAVDAQVRDMFGSDEQGKSAECGGAPDETAGAAAFAKMVQKLEAAAGLPMPLKVSVIRRKESNAVALPGGHIYVFRGLIDKARNPDEVAGVLAHEVGHVANRDGTRSVLQAAGLSFLFGMVLGDFVGGGAVVFAAQTILRLSYSREVETSADLYGVTLMQKAGGNPRALGTILERIAGAIEPGAKILLDHPETKARIALIERVSAAAPSAPFLTAADWAALKRVCGR